MPSGLEVSSRNPSQRCSERTSTTRPEGARCSSFGPVGQTYARSVTSSTAPSLLEDQLVGTHDPEIAAPVTAPHDLREIPGRPARARCRPRRRAMGRRPRRSPARGGRAAGGGTRRSRARSSPCAWTHGGRTRGCPRQDGPLRTAPRDGTSAATTRRSRGRSVRPITWWERKLPDGNPTDRGPGCALGRTQDSGWPRGVAILSTAASNVVASAVSMRSSEPAMMRGPQPYPVKTRSARRRSSCRTRSAG